jgi:hypothetical protein
MKRILVVANRTLCDQHLLDELYRWKAEGPIKVHIVVPVSHPSGMWTDGTVQAGAQARLNDITDTLAVAGIPVTGEVSDAGPAVAVSDVLRRERFDHIILSTLPVGLSRWLSMGTVRRLQRLGVPVTHVVAESADAMA